MKDVIFITWEKHQRTRTICTKLGIKLYEKISVHKGLKRYISLCASTIKVIAKERPRVLVAQNPSVILCILALALRPFFRYQLFIDAHNEAVIPYIHNNTAFRFIARLLARKANLTIVTNSILAETVINHGGKPFILPDLLPASRNEPISLHSANDHFQITLISTYAPDEPYDEVFQAISNIPGNLKMFVTGRVPKNMDNKNIDPRIELTGYLSDQDYDALLHASDLIIDLTTMENCLVCGAYEALALEKPMILSKDPVNEELFPCAVLTGNDAISISTAIKLAITDIKDIQRKTSVYKDKFSEKEQQNLSQFIEMINDDQHSNLFDKEKTY